MRSHLPVRGFLALSVAAALAGSLIPGASGGAASGRRVFARAIGAGPGDFIVRCFYNGNAAHEDPIDAPGSFTTDHVHIFFGNRASGGAAADGTAFPGIQSGDYAASGDTMEGNGLTPATNCQDSKDTAGYWIPEPFQVTSSGSASVLPTLGAGCSTSCNPDTDVYQREYYNPHSAQPEQEIPDGTIMIAGYPLGCANVNNYEPPGCQAGRSYPVDVGVSGVPEITAYSCSGNTAAGLGTPESSWPYDCTSYTDSDDSVPRGFFDGMVATVNFPECWNGQASFPAPNSPAVSGRPAQMVPGYIPPWIPSPYATVWKKKYPKMSLPANDFDYPPNGGAACTSSAFPVPVVQLSERVHLHVNGAGWGEPSTCTGLADFGWNTAANKENSPTPNPEDSDGDGDATVQVSKGLWGFHKCVPASSPSPTATASTLSFSCTSPGDPNCDIPLSKPTGCGSPGGTCYAGAYEYGWETLHADYWQTWQEASDNNANLDNVPGNPPTDGVSSDVGTLGDLVEDCTNGNSGACSFITNTSPGQVYGPPPP